MTRTLWITRWTLVGASRSSFFWIWNIIIVLLIFSLNRFFYFDFGRRGRLVSELFLSTATLAGTVNSIAFQLLVTLRQKRRGEYALLLAGPSGPVIVVVGTFIGVAVIQLFWALLFAAAHGASMALSGRTVPPFIWQAFLVVGLKVLGLSAFHLTVAVFFRETWALMLMVGGYLVGQLSEYFYRNLGVPEILLDLVYCLLPDLEPLGYLMGEATSIPARTLLWLGLNTVLYTVFVLLLGSLRVAASPTFRRGTG